MGASLLSLQRLHILSCGLVPGETLCKEPEHSHYGEVGVLDETQEAFFMYRYCLNV